MKKILSLFARAWDGDRQVRDEVTPGTEWALAGEGVATRKWDGTCCLVRDGRLFKRYEVRRNGHAPSAFEPATEVDPNTGKQQGWVPVDDGPADKYHREAWSAGDPPVDGTYELVGPKVQGNVETLDRHMLLKHGADVIPDCPRTFEAIREYLRTHDMEGVVWHHVDGRMVKIKRKDFGFDRGVEPSA